MVCPICEYSCAVGEDWCPSCGSYLGLLKRRPRHIAKCVNVTIALGLGLFLALAWHVFLPLTEGLPTGKPTGWFWWALGGAAFLLALGLRARHHLQEMRRRVPVKVEREAGVPARERSRAAGGR